MGIVARQSIYNLFSIGFAFLIGSINMLYLYPSFPGKEFQGLIVALLENSNLIQTFLSFYLNFFIEIFRPDYQNTKFINNTASCRPSYACASYLENKRNEDNTLRN